MAVRNTKVDEFALVKNAPRECTQDDYRLMADAEWWDRHRRGIPKHLQVQLYHLVGRAHRSYVQNGRKSPWNDDLSRKPSEEPVPMPLSPNVMPAPDTKTALPDDIRGERQSAMARQFLGFFYEGKPVQIHNIIRKMTANGYEEAGVRNMATILKRNGVLANPDKGVYELIVGDGGLLV